MTGRTSSSAWCRALCAVTWTCDFQLCGVHQAQLQYNQVYFPFDSTYIGNFDSTLLRWTRVMVTATCGRHCAAFRILLPTFHRIHSSCLHGSCTSHLLSLLFLPNVRLSSHLVSILRPGTLRSKNKTQRSSISLKPRRTDSGNAWSLLPRRTLRLVQSWTVWARV